MSAPRVSWLVPVRDAGTTLGEAIASIASQTVSGWEAVIVDDGSRDVSVADLVRRVVGEDPRFRVETRPARGIVASLNHGVALCQGEWIARLDADDIARPDRLERQLAVIAQGVGVIDGKIALFADTGEPPEGMLKWAEWLNALGGEGWFAQRLIDTPVCHPAVLMRRQAVLDVGGYRDGDFPEDFDLWLRMIYAGWRFVRVEGEPVVDVRDSPERLTRSDPRYRREAFDRVRREHLVDTLLRETGPVAVWGAGKTGRRWIRWLLQRGHGVTIVDPYQVGRQCQEHSVFSPSVLGESEVERLLVAVAARGARPSIRAEIQRIRPDLREGEQWLFVA